MRVEGIILLALASSGCRNGDDLRVLAAASMEETIAEIAGPGAEISSGASSLLARQIDAGAPADVYVSASVEWVEWLEARGGAVETASIAGNRLMLIAPATEAPGNGRIALADPTHVPAGRYAKAALEATGAYEPTRVVAAADVRAVLALVERAEVDRGVVYATDVPLAGDRIRVIRTLRSPTPIRYAAARLSDRPAARALMERLTSPEGRAILRRHGFLPLDGE